MQPKELEAWQKCQRLPQLTREYEPARLTPKVAFERIFQKAIREGMSPQEAGVEFLEMAANRGLDTVMDPFILARDYAGALQTALTKIRASGPKEPLRWIVVRQLYNNVIYREVHSWQTTVKLAEQPNRTSSLAFLMIGSEGGGHLHSPWCRVFKHPAIAQRYKFQLVHPDGTIEPLRGKEWKPVFYSDLKSQTPETWVEMMDTDRICPIRTIELKAFTEEAAKKVLREYHAATIEFLNSDAFWEELPMTRGACDFPTPCVYQGLCYAGSNAGLIQLR